MFAYLKRQKIFISFDSFEMEEDGSPGFLIEIHPKLTHKANLEQFLKVESVAVDFETEVEHDLHQTTELCTNILPRYRRRHPF